MSQVTAHFKQATALPASAERQNFEILQKVTSETTKHLTRNSKHANWAINMTAKIEQTTVAGKHLFHIKWQTENVNAVALRKL